MVVSHQAPVLVDDTYLGIRSHQDEADSAKKVDATVKEVRH